MTLGGACRRPCNYRPGSFLGSSCEKNKSQGRTNKAVRFRSRKTPALYPAWDRLRDFRLRTLNKCLARERWLALPINDQEPGSKIYPRVEAVGTPPAGENPARFTSIGVMACSASGKRKRLPQARASTPEAWRHPASVRTERAARLAVNRPGAEAANGLDTFVASNQRMTLVLSAASADRKLATTRELLPDRPARLAA